MVKGAFGVNIQDDTKTESSEKTEAPEKEAERLEHEIEEIRDHLGGLVTELDHRRHRLNPVSIVKRDPWPFAIGGVVVIGAILGGMAWRNARAHRRGSWEGRAQRLRATLGLTRESQPAGNAAPSIGTRILGAAASAAAVIVARRIATRAFARDP
jgi:hypothetical protein